MVVVPERAQRLVQRDGKVVGEAAARGDRDFWVVGAARGRDLEPVKVQVGRRREPVHQGQLDVLARDKMQRRADIVPVVGLSPHHLAADVEPLGLGQQPHPQRARGSGVEGGQVCQRQFRRHARFLLGRRRGRCHGYRGGRRHGRGDGCRHEGCGGTEAGGQQRRTPPHRWFEARDMAEEVAARRALRDDGCPARPCQGCNIAVIRG